MVKQYKKAEEMWVEDAIDEQGVEDFATDDIMEVELSVDDEMWTDDEPSELLPGSELQVDDEMWADDEEEEEAESDWENDRDHAQFIIYITKKLDKIPKHSGNTEIGCERAKHFLKGMDNEIRDAMRTDHDGKIDEIELAQVQEKINDMISKLESHIKKLTAGIKTKIITSGVCPVCESSTPMWEKTATSEQVCMSCDSVFKDNKLVKKAATPSLQVYMTPFERACVGMIINGVVSSGKQIEEVYKFVKEKYELSDREELAIQQLLADHGYPIHKDRGHIGEDGEDVDWLTNYTA